MDLNQPFFLIERDPEGPFTLAQLRDMWRAGQLAAAQRFSQEGSSSERTLSEITHLLEGATTQPNLCASPGAAVPELISVRTPRLPVFLLMGIISIGVVVLTLYLLGR